MKNAGHCAIGEMHHGKYLDCTMTREQAKKESQAAMNRSIWAGFAFMSLILVIMGVMTWLCLSL
jgi:hypothetical protein